LRITLPAYPYTPHPQQNRGGKDTSDLGFFIVKSLPAERPAHAIYFMNLRGIEGKLRGNSVNGNFLEGNFTRGIFGGESSLRSIFGESFRANKIKCTARKP
jgi:hypothetical protein